MIAPLERPLTLLTCSLHSLTFYYHRPCVVAEDSRRFPLLS